MVSAGVQVYGAVPLVRFSCRALVGKISWSLFCTMKTNSRKILAQIFYFSHI